MNEPRLSIVIHAEEEFDWGAGFYRSNTQVSHGSQLIELVEEMLEFGAKVTLAMDYPFVTSSDGRAVIKHFQSYQGKNIEFATHLHPWVSPPYETDQDHVANEYSFPGNLDKQSEFSKLKLLTETIEQISGHRPTTYLAGRYGVGENSAAILKSLGYTVDLSISAYTDFSNMSGPDHSMYSNTTVFDDHLIRVPHTCSVVAPIKGLESYLNSKPKLHASLRRNSISGLALRLLRVKLYRLSPEGFSFQHMKALTESQIRVGQRDFVLSFHSPSVKVGCTPYVQSQAQSSDFKRNLFEYLTYFKTLDQSQFYIPKEWAKDN